MIQQILSYLQVLPAFVDHISSFGFREHNENCSMTGFQKAIRSLEVPELGRSSLRTEHCFGLRAVERLPRHSHWPWAVRQCTVYHSFDVISAQSTWIVVKANRQLEKLAREGMTAEKLPTNGQMPLTCSYKATFTMYELIAVWCGMNWQWYISFLENMLQEVSRPALTTRSTLPSDLHLHDSTARAGNWGNRSPSGADTIKPKEDHTQTGISLKGTYTRVRSMASTKSTKLPVIQPPEVDVFRHRTSFSDLPRLHHLEEMANQALDVLSNNGDVLEDIKQAYEVPCTQAPGAANVHELDMFAAVNCGGRELNEAEAAEVNSSHYNFVSTIESVQKNFRTQHARLRQLLRLLNDRKVLVCITWPEKLLAH
jgi:hypothetical protein